MGQLISSPYLYSYFNYIKRYTSTTFPYEDVVWDIKKLGRIKGKTFQIEGGRKVHAFLGVPFAKCGQFEDRFKVCSSRLPHITFKLSRNPNPLNLGRMSKIVRNLDLDHYRLTCSGITC